MLISLVMDMGVPGGDDNSEANSLNELGQIVGDSGVGSILSYPPAHALLWQNGQWIDLNTLITPDSGYYLIKAFDVNARGEIVVCAVQLNTGNIHAALLAPQPSNVAGNTVALTVGVSGAVPRLSEHARRLLTMARDKKARFRTQPNN